MLVMTLVLAAAGFALLVIALMTGSVIWAWGCILVCVAGAVLLLVSALASRKAVPGEAGPQNRPGAAGPGGPADPGDSESDSTQG